MIKIDKRAVYSARYPYGTVIELTEPINDPYTPKPAGAKFKVDYVDDALQLQGSWLSPERGSMAVDVEHDSFRICPEESQYGVME